jgi:hypothetical protein
VSRPAVSVFLDPLSDAYSGDRLFSHADYNAPNRHVRDSLGSLGIPVHTGDFLLRGEGVGEINLYATMGLRSRYPGISARTDTVLSAFLAQEAPIVEPMLFDDVYEASTAFKRMYSYGTDRELRPFLRGPVAFRPLRYPYWFLAVDDDAWVRRNRRFLVMINANKQPRQTTRELYTERLRAIEFFSRFKEIDLYGWGWGGPPYYVGETRVSSQLRSLAHHARAAWGHVVPSRDPLLVAAKRAYRGPAASKEDVLSRYLFAICFENMVLGGWVTEKIFDCLRAGTVPVYLGAPDIERWVWPECFIDVRRFTGYDELRDFLHALSPAEIETYREAGREYFASDEFRPFTKHAFAEIFEQIVREDAGISL